MAESPLFALVVRFTLREDFEDAFDQLVERTVSQVREHEPDTLVYAVHQVDGHPRQRMFYELYRDRAAFDDHEARAYVKSFLRAREQLLAATEVDVLELVTAKGAPQAEGTS
ncbi:MAG: putative quinol monooxygenase [Nocardioidaceae bacterium]